MVAGWHDGWTKTSIGRLLRCSWEAIDAIVADHGTGNVVWAGKQRSKAAFFTGLGPERAAAIEAISLDGSSVYLPVARE